MSSWHVKSIITLPFETPQVRVGDLHQVDFVLGVSTYDRLCDGIARSRRQADHESPDSAKQHLRFIVWSADRRCVIRHDVERLLDDTAITEQRAGVTWAFGAKSAAHSLDPDIRVARHVRSASIGHLFSVKMSLLGRF